MHRREDDELLLLIFLTDQEMAQEAEDDVLVEPRYTTGRGPKGDILGWGRGPFTERDEDRTIWACFCVPRHELA